MKQTNPSSALRMTVSLGILGLNEDFVQMNEVMTILELIGKEGCVRVRYLNQRQY